MKADLKAALHVPLPPSPFTSRRGPPSAKHVLYRGWGMPFFRVVVRAKVFQLLGFFTAAMLLSSLFVTVRECASAGAGCWCMQARVR